MVITSKSRRSVGQLVNILSINTSTSMQEWIVLYYTIPKKLIYKLEQIKNELAVHNLAVKQSSWQIADQSMTLQSKFKHVSLLPLKKKWDIIFQLSPG